jgi:hypothetical protein
MDPNGDPLPHEVQDGEYWCYGSPPLAVTVETSKQLYYLLELINVYGDLTRGLIPFNWLVTIEVDTPDSQAAVLRTLSTGNPHPTNQQIEIIAAFPCDALGNPKTSFTRGGLGYFNVTVRNNYSESKPIMIAINFYDADNRAIGLVVYRGDIFRNSILSIQRSFPIPDTAALGTALACANALSGWPKSGGAAYCMEKTAVFNIVASGGGGGELGVQELQNVMASSEGTYGVIFKLSKSTKIGNFSVFATSQYERTQAMDSTTFQGKIPDLNGDGKVNLSDLIKLASKFGKTVPPEDPKYDLNGDGKINLSDLIIVAAYFGWG